MFPFWLCKYYSVIQTNKNQKQQRETNIIKTQTKPAKQNNLKWNDNPGERAAGRQAEGRKREHLRHLHTNWGQDASQFIWGRWAGIWGCFARFSRVLLSPPCIHIVKMYGRRCRSIWLKCSHCNCLRNTEKYSIAVRAKWMRSISEFGWIYFRFLNQINVEDISQLSVFLPPPKSKRPNSGCSEFVRPGDASCGFPPYKTNK